MYEEKYDGSPIPLGLTVRNDFQFTKLRKQSTRFQRFCYYIGAARATNDVPLKTANYCSGLEALVSTSQMELSHQASERASCALHEPGEDRLSIYRLAKKGYGIRSKAVHGATFHDKDTENIVKTALGIDEIARRLARRYIADDDFRRAVESGQQSTDFWLKTVLG